MSAKKVSPEIVHTVKKWVEGGAKDKIIANAFNFSVATVQNIKKTKFNYHEYRKLVNSQLSIWTTKDGKSQKAKNSANRFNTIVERLDKIDTRLQYLSSSLINLSSKVDTLTLGFNKVFPKINIKGNKSNERNNSSIQ
jgi:uncharacterized coiled-coil DUF342 family protein|tara:strand:+ start:498 stop:911 length:414 start_codon:yes stop_codon:yes gene_type:complete